jgi:hypothetical protein
VHFPSLTLPALQVPRPLHSLTILVAAMDTIPVDIVDAAPFRLMAEVTVPVMEVVLIDSDW